MKINTTYTCELIPAEGCIPTDDDVEAIIAVVTDELIALGFADAVISGSIVRRTFEISTPATGVTFIAIAERIDSGIRAAFHAAGVATPEWPGIETGLRLERREINFKDPSPDDDTRASDGDTRASDGDGALVDA